MLQVIAWRVRVPTRQVKGLLAIFSGTLLAAQTAGAYAAMVSPSWERFLPHGGAEWLHLGLFHLAATLAYMITYSAVEVDSPSLQIVLTIRRAGTAGLPESELLALRSDDRLVAPRVSDLITDRMATRAGDHYRLTRKGVLLARIFTFYRGILGAGKGG